MKLALKLSRKETLPLGEADAFQPGQCSKPLYLLEHPRLS